MRAATFGRLARIFLLHPFLSFSRERIGSALQGVPWAPRGTPRAVLDPPRGPKRPPGQRSSAYYDFRLGRRLQVQNARSNNDSKGSMYNCT